VQRHVDVLAVVLNIGYFAMLVTWFLRRPESLGNPVGYVLLLVPALCVYAVRLRPFRSLAVFGGIVTGFVNFSLLLAAAIATGISGRRYVEFVLVVVFVFGNAALLLAAWLLAFTRKT
jgi:hypothetical protein